MTRPVDSEYAGSVHAVTDAYERYAARLRKGGYRGSWSYIATKALSDWALLSGLDLTGARVLNVGCCEPIDELFFARLPVRRWVGLDQNQTILAAARTILRDELSSSLGNRVTLCAGDAARLPFPDATFDLVVSFSALEHIPSPATRDQAFAEIARVTRPAGHVAVTLPNRYSLFFFCHRKNMREGIADYGYSYLYSRREFRACLQRVGLQPLRFHSELSGAVNLVSYLPGRRLRDWLRRLGVFGERIGYLARRC